MDIQLIDKRILITGGAGFIGSNLSEYLLEKGCGVVCLDNLATGSIENVNHLSTNPNFTFVEGDIRNISDCHAANKDEVLHEYKLTSTQEVPAHTFDAVVLTVAHTAFLEMNFDSLTNKNHVLYDVKNILPTTIKHGGL